MYGNQVVRAGAAPDSRVGIAPGQEAQGGSDHASHFQFSISEVCDLNASDEFILGREGHWKAVLRTREFGHNGN